MNWEKVICLSPHSKQTAPEMVQIVDKSRGATSKKPVFFFSFCFQCQWKECAVCHPSQHMGTTSWSMDPMMSSSLCSICATSPMNSVGTPREPASQTTPGVGLLLFAPKVRHGVLEIQMDESVQIVQSSFYITIIQIIDQKISLCSEPFSMTSQL